MDSGAPQPEAVRLLTEIQDRLNDPAEGADQFTLRRWLRDLQTATATAPVELLGSLFAAMGACYGRLDDVQASLAAHERAAGYEPDVARHESNIASSLRRSGGCPRPWTTSRWRARSRLATPTCESPST